jgi:hypothetical protein
VQESQGFPAPQSDTTGGAVGIASAVYEAQEVLPLVHCAAPQNERAAMVAMAKEYLFK